jgi:hypothetical protein
MARGAMPAIFQPELPPMGSQSPALPRGGRQRTRPPKQAAGIQPLGKGRPRKQPSNIRSSTNRRRSGIPSWCAPPPPTHAITQCTRTHTMISGLSLQFCTPFGLSTELPREKRMCFANFLAPDLSVFVSVSKFPICGDVSESPNLSYVCCGHPPPPRTISLNTICSHLILCWTHTLLQIFFGCHEFDASASMWRTYIPQKYLMFIRLLRDSLSTKPPLRVPFYIH